MHGALLMRCRDIDSDVFFGIIQETWTQAEQNGPEVCASLDGMLVGCKSSRERELEFGWATW